MRPIPIQSGGKAVNSIAVIGQRAIYNVLATITLIWGLVARCQKHVESR